MGATKQDEIVAVALQDSENALRTALAKSAPAFDRATTGFVEPAEAGAILAARTATMVAIENIIAARRAHERWFAHRVAP